MCEIIKRSRVVIALLLTCQMSAVFSAEQGHYSSAQAVVDTVNLRADAERAQSSIRFRLVQANGSVQEREATAFFLNSGDIKKTAMYFRSPSSLKDSAFLTWDYVDSGRADDQWLYLPVLKRVKRIAGGDRGRAFLGTELSYDDIKSNTRIAQEDYIFEPPVHTESGAWDIRGEVRSAELKAELGYSRAQWLVDTGRGLVLAANTWDLQGQPYKAFEFSDYTSTDGVLYPHRITVKNLRSGVVTELITEERTLGGKFREQSVSQQGLSRGL